MIRLQRSGKKNRSDFRIVLAEKESSASKKVTEILGHYNPRTKDFGIKQDRLQYWISQHVTLSPTIHNLFVTQKLISGNKVKAFSIPAKPAEPEAVPATGQAPTEPVAGSEQAPAEPMAEVEAPAAPPANPESTEEVAK